MLLLLLNLQVDRHTDRNWTHWMEVPLKTVWRAWKSEVSWNTTMTRDPAADDEPVNLSAKTGQVVDRRQLSVCWKRAGGGAIGGAEPSRGRGHLGAEPSGGRDWLWLERRKQKNQERKEPSLRSSWAGFLHFKTNWKYHCRLFLFSKLTAHFLLTSCPNSGSTQHVTAHWALAAVLFLFFGAEWPKCVFFWKQHLKKNKMRIYLNCSVSIL